ncbi:MAG: primosomal replication protein N [Thiobacillus sp.]|nr:primosomal replication protein N [Thiobacillus sp.]
MLDNAGLRHTPAGIAALRLKVAHTGPQEEARRQRTVEMETELVAFGNVAEALAKVEKGSALKLVGFLDRKSVQGNQLELHVTEFGILKSP